MKTMNQVFILFLLSFMAGFDGYGQDFVSLAATGSTGIDIGKTDKASMARFTWAEGSTHDFGKIARGIPVTNTFYFTNTGEVPLLIDNVKASCGCTVADYTKGPIAPGEKGMVRATYNAAKKGAFNKSVTVSANIPEKTMTLYIKGTVLE